MSRRANCERCFRAQRNCICAWITPITNQVDVLILQHPLEVKQAKGSARLLDLSLENSSIMTGEQFDVKALKQYLFADAKTPVLLYPELEIRVQGGMENTTADSLTSSTRQSLKTALAQAPEQLRLVLLDATWRKSRKMMYLNPVLQTLPKLSLLNMPASQYRIRKAHRADQLSSLEAACYALMQLEQEPEPEKQKYLPLLTAFDGFIDQLSAWLPESNRESKPEFNPEAKPGSNPDTAENPEKVEMLSQALKT